MLTEGGMRDGQGSRATGAAEQQNDRVCEAFLVHDASQQWLLAHT